MTREARLVAILSVVVALLAVAALALQLNPPQPETQRVSFKAVEPVDVRRIAINNAAGAFEIAFAGEGYQVGDIPPELVDVDELIALLTAGGQVEAVRMVDATPRDLTPYGLDKPVAQAVIGYADGSELTLLLGAQEPIGGDYYLRVGNDPAVYLLAAERATGLTLPLKAFVEDQVTPPLALSSPLSALLDVTLSGGLLDAPVTVQSVATGDPAVARAALSFGAPTHIVRGRGVYELDQTYGVEMLGSLLGITATEVVDYGLTPAEIAAFGFDQPTMRVAFDLKNGPNAPLTHYELALLRRNDAYYLTCNANGVIYLVPEPAFINIIYDKLPVRWFLSPLLVDVRALELATGGQTLNCVITGATNADKEVTCNGRELDIERFRTFYKLLVSAAHDGALLNDVAVQGEPLMQLTYRYLDEQKQPDIMALYPGDARRLYVQVNGVTELAMREMYLARVQQALDILWTDAPIETDW